MLCSKESIERVLRQDTEFYVKTLNITTQVAAMRQSQAHMFPISAHKSDMCEPAHKDQTATVSTRIAKNYRCYSKHMTAPPTLIADIGAAASASLGGLQPWGSGPNGQQSPQNRFVHIRQ